MSLFGSKTSFSEGAARADEAEVLSAQANMRLVAILNLLEMTKAHGGHKSWSDGQAEALRAMIKICDLLAAGMEPRLLIGPVGLPAVPRLLDGA
jgi:hypothetical protein